MKILLIVYDNDSHVSFFPLGLAYIASVCQKAGYEVSIYNQDVYHWPESHLFEMLNRERFDVVGLGVIAGYYQYRKLLKLSDAINKSKNKPFYIIGGYGPSPEPEYFLKKTQADCVVIGEGEITILELLEAIQGKRTMSSVNGIAFMENGKYIQTPRRKLIKNIDDLSFPAWDMFPIDHYALFRDPNMENSDRWMPVISGRGCPFICNFCYRMDTGFRPRVAEGIIEEIKLLNKNYAISYIEFADDLLMSSVERTISLCESFISAKLAVKWACNGRLNFAKPDVLKLMKAAGCMFINYGIEAMDDQVLKNTSKALTTKLVIKGIENTLEAGISPGYNIIFGNLGDSKETLRKGVEFLLKYDDGAQMRTIRPVTPYPGSPLYYYAIEKGLLKDCEDFYENKHLNSDLLAVNFTDMSDDEFHKSLMDANIKLLENYYKNKLNSMVKQTQDLYLNKDISFRGYRHT